MSGGHFDYTEFRIDDAAEKIDNLITSNNVKDELGYAREFSPEIIERFREAAYTLRRASEMLRRVDYLVCGDDGEETFMRRWKEEVRPLWTK